MTRYHAADSARVGAATLALVASIWLAPEANAQCLQSGNDVQCTGTDPDGFESIISGITLTVQPGANVQNNGTEPSISLKSTSEVTIGQAGAVTATGESVLAVLGVSGNTLTNRGDIIISGSQTTGVLLGPGGGLINEATGRVLASPGILTGSTVATQAGNGGSVTNDGLIRASGDGSASVVALSNVTVTNSGTISAPGATGKGVIIGNGSNLDNSGSILATGVDGIGVRLDGSAGATNVGVIQGGDGTGAGVLIQTSADTFFTNSVGGSVSAASGVAIQGAGGRSTISNSGTLGGDVLLDGGSDLFRWGTGSSVAGVLDGGDETDDLILFQSDPASPVDDTFDLGDGVGFESLTIGDPGDGGSWTLTGSGSYGNGILLVAGTAQFSDGMIIGDTVTVQGGDARLGHSVNFLNGITVSGGRAVFEVGGDTQADLVVASGGTATVEGLSPLSGDVTFQGGSFYEVGFDATTHSRLDVTGTISIETGASLALTPQDATPQDRTIRILTATDAFAGQFDTITGGSAFQVVTDPTYGSSAGVNFLDITVQTSFGVPARSPNQVRVGEYLDLLSQLAPSADFAALLSSLQDLTSASAGRQALEALHPEFYDVHTSASLQTGSTYAGMLARRPLRCERLASLDQPRRTSLEPCSQRGWTRWIDGFGLYTIRNGDDDFADWSYGGGGMAFGIDHNLGESLLLSAMVGTSRMALDFDGAGDGSLTTFDLGLGGAWHHDGTHVRGVVEYGRGWHRTRRHIGIPGFQRLALSDHQSDRLTSRLEAGHTFVFTPFEIGPLAAVEYSVLSESSFSERNAGVVALDVDSRSSSLLTTRAGLRAGLTLVKQAYAGKWLEWADGVWRPEFTGSWTQVWNGYDRALLARLSGAPAGTPEFRTRTRDARWGAELGAHVSFQPHGSRHSIEAGYEVFVGDGTVSQAVMLRLRMPL